MSKGIGQVKLSIKLLPKLSVKLPFKKNRKWITDHYQLSIVGDRRKTERDNEASSQEKELFG